MNGRAGKPRPTATWAAFANVNAKPNQGDTKLLSSRFVQTRHLALASQTPEDSSVFFPLSETAPTLSTLLLASLDPRPPDCASFPLHGQPLLPAESRLQLHATSVFQCFSPDRDGTRNPQSTLLLLFPTWLSGRPCPSRRLPARPVLKPWHSVRRVGCHLGLRVRLMG